MDFLYKRENERFVIDHVIRYSVPFVGWVAAENGIVLALKDA